MDQALDQALDALCDVLEAESRPVATAVEVADHLDVSRPTAADRLWSLRARGDVATDKVGRTRVWWVSPAKTPEQPPAKAGEESEHGTVTPAKSPEKTPTESSEFSPEQPPASGGGGDGPDSAEAVVDKVADGWVDDPDRIADRRAAARAVLEAAVDAEYFGREDAMSFYEQHPVEGQDEETWWRKNARPVLQEIGEYSRGKHAYQITDPPGKDGDG